MDLESGKNKEGRANIIQSVQTPLGFFSLVVLITEAVLGVLAVKATGSDFTILVVSMVVVLFLLVIIVGYSSFKKTNISTTDEGEKTREDLPIELPGELTRFKKQNSDLQKENQELKDQLGKFNSLKISVRGAIGEGSSVSVDYILRELGFQTNNCEARKNVLNVIGQLIDEGKVKGKGYLQGYYFGISEKT